jgi:uncharacterized BrkB/YihY/UPF0761 family membrane protein
MLQYSVQQNQWLIMALFGGFALVLLSVLGYLALWRPRQPQAEGSASFGRWTRSYLPWVLVVVYVAAAVFMVIYVWMRAASPPNW